MTREVELSYDFIHWVKSFNITVELLKTLMPSLAHHFDNIFYDANSLTLALLSEWRWSWVERGVAGVGGGAR